MFPELKHVRDVASRKKNTKNPGAALCFAKHKTNNQATSYWW